MHTSIRLGHMAFAALMLFGLNTVFGQVVSSRWVRTQDWTGTGDMQTEMFCLYGPKWRIRYISKGKEPFSIELTDLDSGSSKLLVSNKKSIKAPGICKGQGSHKACFLRITGGRNTWQVVVEQYLDATDEWNYEQAKKAQPPLVKLGSWGGEPGDHELKFSTTRELWCLSFEQLGKGSLNIDVVDADGNSLFVHRSVKEGKGQFWIHSNGSFTLRVHAADAFWNCHAEARDQ